jgi:hypothetical protein
MSEKPSALSSRRTCSTVISARSAPARRISARRAQEQRSAVGIPKIGKKTYALLADVAQASKLCRGFVPQPAPPR